MVFPSTDKKKEILEKYTKRWNGIKNQIETINGGKPIEYKKDFIELGWSKMIIYPWVKHYVFLLW